jgi:site-specific DNA recombinase
LHRSPRELEEYVDLCERKKIITQTVKAGELDLATPSGRAVARTLGAWSRFEVEHKSERTRRAQLQAAEAGKWLGGARPFGWSLRADGSAVLDKREATEVRRAAQTLLAGGSLGGIAADLNRRGVVTSTGRPWSLTSLRQVLIRPRNAGIVTYGGEPVGTSPWTPLLPEETWRAVCALLADPSRRRSFSNRHRWLLAGLALCPCGATVRSATVNSNRAVGTVRTVYRCRVGGVGHVARAAVPVDELVTAVVLERLRQADAASLSAPDTTEDVNELRSEAMALRARLSDADDMFADGELTRVRHERMVARVQDQLAAVESRLANAGRQSALGDFATGRDPALVWNGLAMDRRRAIVDTLLTVTLQATGRRGNVFDPTSVQIGWKT